MSMLKWRVLFYREKTDQYGSCLVWEKTAKDAIGWCRGYFGFREGITLDAVLLEE